MNEQVEQRRCAKRQNDGESEPRKGLDAREEPREGRVEKNLDTDAPCRRNDSVLVLRNEVEDEESRAKDLSSWMRKDVQLCIAYEREGQHDVEERQYSRGAADKELDDAAASSETLRVRMAKGKGTDHEEQGDARTAIHDEGPRPGWNQRAEARDEKQVKQEHVHGGNAAHAVEENQPGRAVSCRASANSRFRRCQPAHANRYSPKFVSRIARRRPGARIGPRVIRRSVA